VGGGRGFLDLLGGYGNEMRQRGGALTDLAKGF
jgi:hypothetical protein